MLIKVGRKSCSIWLQRVCQINSNMKQLHQIMIWTKDIKISKKGLTQNWLSLVKSLLRQRNWTQTISRLLQFRDKVESSQRTKKDFVKLSKKMKLLKSYMIISSRSSKKSIISIKRHSLNILKLWESYQDSGESSLTATPCAPSFKKQTMSMKRSQTWWLLKMKYWKMKSLSWITLLKRVSNCSNQNLLTSFRI